MSPQVALFWLAMLLLFIGFGCAVYSLCLLLYENRLLSKAWRELLSEDPSAQEPPEEAFTENDDYLGDQPKVRKL